MLSADVLARLEDGALDDLVGHVLDHLMNQPVHALVEADWLAGQIVTSLDAASESDQTEAWIRDRIAELRANPTTGSLRDHIPAEVTEPVREMVERPFVPDRAILGRLMGHKAVEALIRDLLVGAIQSFLQRVRPSVPGAGLGRGLKSLNKVRKGVLGGIGQELEKQAEGRVREFVDSMLSQMLGQVADNLCNPRDAEVYGRFRGHLMDQILDTPMQDLDREIGKMDPNSLVATGTAIAQALAQRKGLRDEITNLVQIGLDTMGDRTIGEHLAQAGIAEDWRKDVEPQLVQRCLDFVRTDPFTDWLGALLDDPARPAD